jgi:hypothetical protein
LDEIASTGICITGNTLTASDCAKIRELKQIEITPNSKAGSIFLIIYN